MYKIQKGKIDDKTVYLVLDDRNVIISKHKNMIDAKQKMYDHNRKYLQLKDTKEYKLLMELEEYLTEIDNTNLSKDDFFKKNTLIARIRNIKIKEN